MGDTGRAPAPRRDAPRRDAPGRPWRPFRLLAITQAAHAAGDVLVAVALADTLFFSVPLGEARGKVVLYLALTMAPFAVLSPLVGPWLDRRRGSYRVAIVAAMTGRVVLAVLLSSRTDRLYLYPLAFGLLVLSRVHGVSRGALVPETLPPGRSLMWANARLAVISVAGGTLGAGPALGLNRWVGSSATLWAAAVAFGAGALAAMGLPPGEGGARRRARDGRALLTPRLLAGGVAMATLRAAVGFSTVLLAFLLRARGEGGKALALVVAAAGLGGLAGSVVAPVLRAAVRELPLLLVSLATGAAAALWAALEFSVARAALLAGLVGLAAGGGRLAFDGLVQQDAPEQVRARTFARYESIFQLAWVVGAGLAAAVPFGPPPGLATLAAICVAGALLAASARLRRQVAAGLAAWAAAAGRGGGALARRGAAALRAAPRSLRRRGRAGAAGVDAGAAARAAGPPTADE